MHFKKLQNSRGFSLIELMTVMGIIGILAAMSMIYLNGNIRRARDSAARSDLRNMIVVINEHYANFEKLVDFDIYVGKGWVTGPIGDPPIYTLSPNVEIEFGGATQNKNSPWYPGIFEATFRHRTGTPGAEFYVLINEETRQTIVGFWE